MKKFLNYTTTLYLICSQSILLSYAWITYPNCDWLWFSFGAHSDFYLFMAAGWADIPGSYWLMLLCVIFQIILFTLGVRSITRQRYGWYTILVWVDFLLTFGLIQTELAPFLPCVWTNAVYALIMTAAWILSRRSNSNPELQNS